jgi:antitoxin component YwqK of YwqJK toxin-antitoxin module
MSMTRRNCWWLASLGATCAVSGLTAQESQADEKRSILIFTSSANEVPLTLSSPSSEASGNVSLKLVKSQPEEALATEVADVDVETIRERFPNGRERVERQVALDANGDFKNHGRYQEWTVNGDLVSTGSFEMGLRQGPWIKMCRTQDAKLFETYPYSKFKPPFQSTVDFASDKMNGIWILTDADHRVVSQVSLTDGVREGTSTWFHPNGKILYQAEYKNGTLNGAFIEKGQDEKIIRNEQYTEGKRVEVEREYYPSKIKKSEISYLTASPTLLSQDDWVHTKLAVYDKVTNKIKHGSFQSFFENAQLKSKGTYDYGILVGEFESYYSNGQKESSGNYAKGKQDGKWTWWHANGMRATEAIYAEGQVDGEVLAWNEAGKRLTNTNGIVQESQLADDVSAPRQATILPSVR